MPLLKDKIFSEIKSSKDNKITFKHFMELSLYDTEFGYYSAGNVQFGKDGDFYTSVHVTRVFGEILASYFISLTKLIEKEIVLVEVGPGDGTLMNTIYKALSAKGVNWDIYLVEKSEVLREQQRRNINNDASLNFVSSIEEVPSTPFSIVFCNELFDAFSVHRVLKVGGSLKEVYIATNDGEFFETEDKVSNSNVESCVNKFYTDLKDGQAVEVNTEALGFQRDAYNWLQSGYLLSIDYGDDGDVLRSSIRYIKEHKLLESPFEDVGNIDITSNVNFNMLKLYGKELGFNNYYFNSQGSFLLDQGIMDYVSDLESNPFSKEAKLKRSILQLVHPDAMGEKFKVLLQAKGVNDYVNQT